MKRHDLKTLIEEKKARLAEQYRGMAGSGNPQIITMQMQTLAEIRAYDAVLEALRGNPVFLKI